MSEEQINCPECHGTNLAADMYCTYYVDDDGIWNVEDGDSLSTDQLWPGALVRCMDCDNEWEHEPSPGTPLPDHLAALLASDAKADATGRALVDLLQLRTRRDNGRIDTAWGDKTPAGLARTVARLLAEQIERDDTGRAAA